MNPIIRNILAVIVGSFVAMFVNGSIISLGGEMLPVPEGIDPNDIESIKANIDRYTPVHFIAPFLAHAIGSLVGAIIACLIGVSRHRLLALIVVGFHFLGGLAMVVMLDFKPISFTVIDLVFAYFPMGLLAWKMTGSKN
jgi:hypothetical protein